MNKEAHLEFYSLNKLETFDPEAFISSNAVEQQACDYILCLSAIFNDIRDLMLALYWLKKVKPDEPVKENIEWGTYTGILIHIMKNSMGIINELIVLTEKHKTLFGEKFFKDILSKIKKKDREILYEILQIAQGRQSSSSVGNFLIRVRNNVAFHYDPKEIRKGYKKHFFNGSKTINKAYISRGGSFSKTKYYFADAAMNGWFEEKANVYSLLKDTSDLSSKLNTTLLKLISSFIQARGYAFR